MEPQVEGCFFPTAVLHWDQAPKQHPGEACEQNHCGVLNSKWVFHQDGFYYWSQVLCNVVFQVQKCRSEMLSNIQER